MKIVSKIIRIVNGSFVGGFCLGCFPNNLQIRYNDKKYNNIQIPLMTGIITSMGTILSPLMIINYFCNGVYFDKMIDKYDITMKRYHQYDGKDSKYGYPSLLILDIKSKKKNEQ